MGYVTTPNSSIDSDIFIEIRNAAVKAKVVKLPFA